MSESETDAARERRQDALRSVDTYLEGAESLLPYAIRSNVVSLLFAPLRTPPPLMIMVLVLVGIGTVLLGALLSTILPLYTSLIGGFVFSNLAYVAVCVWLSRFWIQQTDARERLEGELLALEARLGEAEMEDILLRQDDVLLSSLSYPKLKVYLSDLRSALQEASAR